MNQRGFTLVEVVFALAIAAISFITIAGILRSNITGQSRDVSGELQNGVRWYIYESPILVPGATGLVRYEIQTEDDPRIRFNVILQSGPNE